MGDFISEQSISENSKELDRNFPGEINKVSQSDEPGSFDKNNDVEVDFENFLKEELPVEGLNLEGIMRKYKGELTKQEVQDQLVNLVNIGLLSEDDDVIKGKTYYRDTLNEIE
jgi:hypothetical protein